MLINQIHEATVHNTAIGFGLIASSFRTLLSSVATSYMPGTLAESGERK